MGGLSVSLMPTIKVYYLFPEPPLGLAARCALACACLDPRLIFRTRSTQTYRRTLQEQARDGVIRKSQQLVRRRARSALARA